jgi:protein O-GlcNAc transferase
MGNHREHLECYTTIDIALDATPWSSATTGFEALLMGVPLVAIRGDCLSARMSSSLVKGVGLPDLVAENPSDYAAIVKDLAADLPTLRAGKPERQRRMLASPLCDTADLAAHLGDAFEAMAARAGIQPA